MRLAAPALLAAFFPLAAAAAAPGADEIVRQVLDSDPWGLGGGDVTAHAVLKDKREATSELTFSARSVRYDPPLAKSLVRFSAPADLAGAGFLQTQKKDGDDDRYLFLPELKRSRRISGNLRSNAFMGTDFSFADLDRRDLRESKAALKEDETLGKYPCWHVEVTPARADSEYAKIELWVRQDNFLPLKMVMFDRAGVLAKTLEAKEVRRVGGKWFIGKSKMTNHKESHTTELTLEKIDPRTDIPDEEFSVRNLEKM